MPNPFPMTGTWAGAPWTGGAHALLNLGEGQPAKLYLWGHSPVEAGIMGDQEMTAWVVFNGPGEYVLDSTNVQYLVLLGGDVTLEAYSGTGSPAGLLTVTAVDSSARILEGTFSFATKAMRANPSHGASPKFEGGTFKSKYVILP